MTCYSSGLGSGRAGSQSHRWCDTDPAWPGQTLPHHLRQSPVPPEAGSMAQADPVSPGLQSSPDAFAMRKGRRNDFQDLLFIARGVNSVQGRRDPARKRLQRRLRVLHRAGRVPARFSGSASCPSSLTPGEENGCAGDDGVVQTFRTEGKHGGNAYSTTLSL